MPSVKPLAPEVEEDLVRFESNIKSLRAGQLDPNEFKKFRLNNGVYTFATPRICT